LSRTYFRCSSRPAAESAPARALSKRITGYINWKRNRARTWPAMHAGAARRGDAEEGADHVAVTGDLTNLALDAEIANAAAWLESLGDPADVSAVPGNHDAYVPGALARAVAAWRPT
jgi:3',5'-cyclic AMP phosphodiesterase CpdA